MFQHLSWLIQRIATPARAWACLALLLATMALVNLADLPCTGPRLSHLTAGRTFLDLRWYYTSREAWTAVSGYGPTGRAACLGFYATWDVAIPLLAFGFSAMALTLLWDHPGPRRCFLLVPSAALGFDLLENGLLALVILRFPAPSVALAAAAGVVTALKWVAYALCLGLVAAGAGIYANLSARNRLKPPSLITRRPPCGAVM